jgi:hypothetical protein
VLCHVLLALLLLHLLPLLRFPLLLPLPLLFHQAY